MSIRRHVHNPDETGIDLAPMDRISSVMNLLIQLELEIVR